MATDVCNCVIRRGYRDKEKPRVVEEEASYRGILMQLGSTDDIGLRYPDAASQHANLSAILRNKVGRRVRITIEVERDE